MLDKKTQQKTSLRRIKRALLVDVETCNYQQIVMEFSYYLLNEHNVPSEKKCYIIQQVWENEYFRNGLFSKEKLEHWQDMLDNGQAELISIYYLYNKVNKLIKDKKVQYFIGFNGFFDRGAMEKTYSYFKADTFKENLLCSLDVIDLWDYAKTLYTTTDYIKWALKNTMFTPKGKISTSVETLTKYLKEELGYSETHFGIEDLEVEYMIYTISQLTNTKKRNNSIDINVKGSWQTVEKQRLILETAGKI